MALQNVFETHFQNEMQDSYRIRIYDMDYTAGADMTSLYGATAGNLPTTLTTRHEGITIEYDGDESSLAKPIIGSALQLELLLTNSLDRKIIEAIKERPEHTLGIILFRHNDTNTNLTDESNWDAIWKGVLNHESVTYAFSDLPIELNVTFSDGLALLKDQPYLDSNNDEWIGGIDASTAGSRNAPLRLQIGRCLSRLPHLSLWGDTQNFFSEQLDVYHWHHIDDTDGNKIKSILDKSNCDQFTWYDERDNDGPWYREARRLTQGSTCYQIIEDIMTTFGCSFFMFDGMFNAVSAFLQEDSAVENGLRKWLSDKRTLLTPAFQYSAASQPSTYADGTDYPNTIDYTEEEDIRYLINSTRSFLPPLARMYITHINSGANAIFSQKGILRGNLTGGTDVTVFGDNGEVLENAVYNFPIENVDAIVKSEAVLTLRFDLNISSALQDADDIGRQPFLKIKLKVGDQYLKQNVALQTLTADSDFGNIRISPLNALVPSGNDITTWKPLIIDSDVEWTSVDSFFYLPLLIPEVVEDGWDVIEYQNGSVVTEYAVGLNTVRDPNHPNQMRFSNSLYETQQVSIPIDMQIPALDTSATDYQGVYLDVQLEAYDNTGSLQTFPNTASSSFVHGTIRHFELLNGESAYDSDSIAYSEANQYSQTSETVEIGQSLIGTRQNDGKVVGALAVGDGHRTNNLVDSGYEENWFSQSTDTFPTSAPGRGILSVIADNHFSNRLTTLNTFQMELLFRDFFQKHLYPQSRVLIKVANTDTVVQVQTIRHNLVAGTQSITGYEVDRIYTGSTSGDSVGVGAFLNEGKKGPRVLADIANFVRDNQVGGSGSGLTQEQINKLLAITINGSGQITDFDVPTGQDVLNVNNITSAASTTTTTTLNQYITDIQHKTDNITINASNQITGITTNDEAIGARSILEGTTRVFVTPAEKTAIGTNTSSISTNSSSITTIQQTLKTSTSGGGKGIYNDPASTGESYVGLTATTAHLQGGENGSVDVEDDNISLRVQTGTGASEASTSALQIDGSTSAGVTNVQFNGTTSGIDHDDLDNRPPRYHGIGLDAAGTGGILIGSGSVDFVVGDLLSFTYDSNAGIWECDTAVTIDQELTSTAVFANWLVAVGSFTQVGARGDLSLGSLDSSTSADSFNDSLATFQLTCSGTATITSSTLIGLFGTVFSTGTVTAANLSTSGTGTVGTLVASSLNYPTADGTSGQALTTDGSGNLSFSTVGGGGSTPPLPLANISGRWQWSSADDGERVLTGSTAYGPFNWYSFSSEPSASTIRLYNASHVVDSTSATMPVYYATAFGIRMPTTDRKLRVDFQFRIQNAPSGSSWGMSLWGCALPSNGTTSQVSYTLRGVSGSVTTTSTSSTAFYHGSFTTTANIADAFILPMMENRSGSLTSTNYMYGQMAIYLVE